MVGDLFSFNSDLGRRNQVLDNDAANNGPKIVDMFNFGFQADLLDTNFVSREDPAAPFGVTFTFACDENTWFGNTWGTGGYFPDPAFADETFPMPEGACTTAGGSEAPAPAATGTATADVGRASDDQTAQRLAVSYDKLARGHPPMPR